ncbi:hypothetical protein V1477_017983 [Vespula maculifrons]|uniref:Uncharacterized protein n=1 Tax=Vespula maculifrons TaxID=7453 RepID=A0ABD2AZY4_VESMC
MYKDSFVSGQSCYCRISLHKSHRLWASLVVELAEEVSGCHGRENNSVEVRRSLVEPPRHWSTPIFVQVVWKSPRDSVER